MSKWSDEQRKRMGEGPYARAYVDHLLDQTDTPDEVQIDYRERLVPMSKLPTLDLRTMNFSSDYQRLDFWSLLVRIRWDWTCQLCSTFRPKRLSAHHIIHVDQNESLIYELSNGIALCQSCHVKLHLSIDGEEGLHRRSQNMKKLNDRIALGEVQHSGLGVTRRTETRDRISDRALQRYTEPTTKFWILTKRHATCIQKGTGRSLTFKTGMYVRREFLECVEIILTQNDDSAKDYIDQLFTQRPNWFEETE